MAETVEPRQRIPALLLALAILTSALAAFNGFPRYDVPQTALGSVLALAALVVSGIRPARVPRATMMVGLGIGGAFAYGLVAALLMDADPAMLDAVATLSLAFSGTVVAYRALSDRSAIDIFAVAIGLAALASGVLTLVQFAGLDFPPPIPHSTLEDVGAHGPFDDPWVAGAWFALALPLSLTLARATTGVGRLFAWAGAAGAFLGLAFGSFWWAPVYVAGGALLAGLLSGAGPVVGIRATAPALVAGLVAAALSVAIAQPNLEAGDTAETLGFDPDDTSFDQMVTGNATPYLTEEGGTSFYLEASKAYASTGLPFGHGPGQFTFEIGEHYDYDSEFALRHNNGIPDASRAPSAALQLVGDHGAFVLLFLLAAMVLSVAAARGATPAKSSPFGSESAALASTAVLTALGVLAWGSGALTGGAMLLVGLSIGAAAAHASAGGTRSASPGYATAAIAAALVALVGFSQVQTFRWAFHEARGTVFLGAGELNLATEALEDADEIQARYSTRLNLGLAMSMNPPQNADETPPVVRIREALASAAEMHPHSTNARYILANFSARNMSTIVTTLDEAADTGNNIIGTLNYIIDLDPNHLEAALLLAQVRGAVGNGDGAIAALEPMVERDIPADARSRLLFNLALIIMEFQDTPEPAYEYLLEAQELDNNIARQSVINQKLEILEIWMATGSRPSVVGAPPGFEPDDGHGHGHAPQSPGLQVPANEREPGHSGDDHDGHDHDGHDHNHEEQMRDIYAPQQDSLEGSGN